MLRVGLTGDLGSGKSTVARMLAERGAHVFNSDDMARAMMQPGHEVYAQIVAHFGDGVLQPGSEQLDRSALARMAFIEGRVEELNAIVHPAVLADQARIIEDIAAREPQAIVVVESALMLTTKHGDGPWSKRFDEVIVVTAPEAVKIERFIARAGTLSASDRAILAAEAGRRLALQRNMPDDDCIVLRNDRDLATLEQRVAAIWLVLWRKSGR